MVGSWLYPRTLDWAVIVQKIIKNLTHRRHGRRLQRRRGRFDVEIAERHVPGVTRRREGASERHAGLNDGRTGNGHRVVVRHHRRERLSAGYCHCAGGVGKAH
jgi:hypothetical protein